MSDHLILAEVLTIHYDQIERYGGSHGIRDAGQLEAALFRPQSGYYEDSIAEAAALWESLSQNHPFINGNKRTAFACCLAFLAVNNIEITATSEQTEAFLIPLYDKQGLNFIELDGWLRKNTETRKASDT